MGVELKWTPAEVNQILFRNFDDPTAALDELATLTSKDLYGFQIDEAGAPQIMI
jgi:hypothetical protein